MEVKVFLAAGLRRKSLDQLEDQVNGWLKDNPEVKVVEIKQMAVGSFGNMLDLAADEPGLAEGLEVVEIEARVVRVVARHGSSPGCC